MSAAPRIIIAGAGIGGLTAALTLSRAGFGVTVLEAAPELTEIGAGVQLSSNATNVLLALGLGSELKRHIVAPERLRVMQARSGRELVSMPLGLTGAVRYHAPFWAIHRADLQRVLANAVGASSIDLHLGVRVEDFAKRGEKIVVVGRGKMATVQFEGDALIGADGIWSKVREKLGIAIKPMFTRQTAWRALIPADQVDPMLREPATVLWLAPQAHVVHYPVRAGAFVNIVAIIREDWDAPGWTAPGDPAVLQAWAKKWAAPLKALITMPGQWEKWALHEQAPLPQWGTGRATLLGDAAHAMRPFLAQGAAMAIEDAAVLARHVAARRDDIPAALRAYEAERQPRTALVQAEASRTGRRYAWRRPLAFVRDLALRRMGGEKLLTRYDWIYDWKDG